MRNQLVKIAGFKRAGLTLFCMNISDTTKRNVDGNPLGFIALPPQMPPGTWEASGWTGLQMAATRAKTWVMQMQHGCLSLGLGVVVQHWQEVSTGGDLEVPGKAAAGGGVSSV